MRRKNLDNPVLCQIQAFIGSRLSTPEISHRRVEWPSSTFTSHRDSGPPLPFFFRLRRRNISRLRHPKAMHERAQALHPARQSVRRGGGLLNNAGVFLSRPTHSFDGVVHLMQPRRLIVGVRRNRRDGRVDFGDLIENAPNRPARLSDHFDALLDQLARSHDQGLEFLRPLG